MNLVRRLRPGMAATICIVSAACSGAVPAAPPVAQREVKAPSPPTAPVIARPASPAGFRLDGEFTQGGWAKGTAPVGTVSLSLDGTPVAVAPDLTFLAAFDRDASSSARLVARLADGRELSRDIAVSPRAWRIEHVPVAPRPPAIPSAEFQRRRADELARIATARALDTGSTGWRQAFAWPARGRLSGLFGSQRIYKGTPGSYHSGMDIATGTSGTPFTAPADGVVVLAAQSPFTLEGHLLMIDHGMGLNSAFLHCSQVLVKEGDTVRQGQVIGRIGMSGRASGPHLHWSLKWRDARLDPLLWLPPAR